MSGWTATDKAEVIEMYFKNNSSIISTQREYNRVKKPREAPHRNLITRWVSRW